MSFKTKLIYLFILSLMMSSIIFVYNYFNETSLPVFDGVMNEKAQIIRYLNFKGDYSIKQRLIQAYFELKGNPVTAGFNILTMFLCPHWLANDYDILFRAIFGLVVLIWTFHHFFKHRKNTIWSLFLLISGFPLFYHYRFGLMTYVPELISGVLVICGYLNLLMFQRDKRWYYFFNTLWMSLFAIFFRYNFFAYVALLYLPFIFFTLKILIQEKREKRLFYIFAIILYLLISSFYITLHFDDFLNYYDRPATYENSDLLHSLFFFFKYLKYELGLGYILTLVIVIFLNNGTETSKTLYKSNILDNLKLLYPFIILFSFLVVYLHAGNQPHIFAFLYLTTLPFGFLTFTKINTPSRFNSQKVKFTLIFISILSSFTFFYTKVHNQYNTELNKDGLLLADKIEQNLKNTKDIKYFILFDSALEIPLDVYFFKKNNVWNNNQLRFYFTDWDYYGISQTLNLDEISNYYIQKIKSIKPKLIFINESKLHLGKGRELAQMVNDSLRKYILSMGSYENKEVFIYKNQRINIYKLSDNLVNS